MPPGEDKNNGLFWKRQELIASAPLSIREKWALQVIFIRAGWKDGGECFASNEELQQLFGVGLTQTKQLIRSLVSYGIVSNIDNGKGPNIRAINWVVLEQFKGSEIRPEGVGKPTSKNRPGGRNPDSTLYRTSLEQPINNPKGKSGSRSKRFKAEEIDLPASLDTPEFRHAWGEWCCYRRSHRKPISERAARKQIDQLERAGPMAAIEAIQTSIANDWQGLFPKDQHGGKNHDRNHIGPGQKFDPSTVGQPTGFE